MTMKLLTTTGFLLCVVTSIQAAEPNHQLCQEQAAAVISRLEADVVGTLDSTQREKANEIVIDICQSREEEVQEQITEAVENTREEEQENANSWLNESPDKAGNKRLKRKGMY